MQLLRFDGSEQPRAARYRALQQPGSQLDRVERKIAMRKDRTVSGYAVVGVELGFRQIACRQAGGEPQLRFLAQRRARENVACQIQVRAVSQDTGDVEFADPVSQVLNRQP